MNKNLFILHVREFDSIHVYSTKKKAKEAMRLAAEYLVHNMDLKGKVTVDLQDAWARILANDEEKVYVYITEESLNNFFVWKTQR